MSSFLCFICNNAVNNDTVENTREKFKDIVGINLCPDSHLCYICSYMVNKLWLFKSLCLKRSLEYPVLFREKQIINLNKSDIDTLVLCNEDSCTTNCVNEHNDSNDYIKFEIKYDETNKYPENEPYCDGNKADISLTQDEKGNKSNDSFENECNDSFVENDDNETGVYDLNEIGDDCVEEVGEGSETSNQTVTQKKDFVKIILSLEEQKTELESRRRTKKYIEAEFKCYHCAIGFLFKDSYQTHMMRHEESNGEYVCSVCSIRFASTAVLRSHRVGHKERYECCLCGITVRHSQKRTHARRCHGKEGDTAACHLCGNVFQDAQGLQQHLRRFHLSKTSNRTYPCSVCGKTYNNQAAVRYHMIKHIQKKFVCDQCPSNFSSPYSLNEHKKKHTIIQNDITYICEICKISYTSRKSLLAHLRTAAPHQEKAYDCPICNRICPNPRALSLHIDRIHKSTKDFQCPHCTNKYSCRKSLVRHIRDHTSLPKPKMAQCYLCGKSFKSNSKLNRHLREVCKKNKLEELMNYNDLNAV